MSAEGIKFTPVTDINDGEGTENIELGYWAQSLDGLVRKPAMCSWLLAVNQPAVLKGYGEDLATSHATLREERRRMASAQGTGVPGLRAYLITEVSEPSILALGHVGKLIGKSVIDHEVTLRQVPSSSLGKLASRVKGRPEVRLPGRTANASVVLDPTVEDFPYKLQASLHTLCMSASPDTTLWHAVPASYLELDENYRQALESNGFEQRGAGRFYYGGTTVEEWGAPESVLFVRPVRSGV